MMTKQEAKARVAHVKVGMAFVHETASMSADVLVGARDPEDDTVRLTIEGQWVTADACMELSALFKRMAKQLAKPAT